METDLCRRVWMIRLRLLKARNCFRTGKRGGKAVEKKREAKAGEEKNGS